MIVTMFITAMSISWRKN